MESRGHWLVGSGCANWLFGIAQQSIYLSLFPPNILSVVSIYNSFFCNSGITGTTYTPVYLFSLENYDKKMHTPTTEMYSKDIFHLCFCRKDVVKEIKGWILFYLTIGSGSSPPGSATLVQILVFSMVLILCGCHQT